MIEGVSPIVAACWKFNLTQGNSYVADLERRIRELETLSQAFDNTMELPPTEETYGISGHIQLESDSRLSQPSPPRSSAPQYVGDSSEIKYA